MPAYEPTDGDDGSDSDPSLSALFAQRLGLGLGLGLGLFEQLWAVTRSAVQGSDPNPNPTLTLTLAPALTLTLTLTVTLTPARPTRRSATG